MSATKKFPTHLTAASRGALRSATALGRVLTVAAAATAITSEGAKAGPKGGVVKAGSATITTRGGSTTINQAGQKVVIDWQSFDIDANEAVNFLQPGKGSIALNRVLNDLPTHIRGQLTANGNIWIVNQHGVTFHAGSVVNVGSLIATTADISNADFMAGNYKFDKPGDPNAKIINEGDITFGEAGLAAFVAPNAANRGVIAGKMGKVVIAGNETFAIDLAGDGMWAFTMGEGANAASAANSGRIHNPGGYILISARAAQGMVDSQISVGGVVEATTAKVEGGKIVLSGDGFVEVSGALDATGSEAGQVGGSIEVTGDKVHVTAMAKIDASGDAGGGKIKIGGDYQGGGSLETAARTLVSEGAEIRASAIGQVGDGGEVIVWADEITGFFGSIQATGGANAGDGGFAEVSGKQQLAFDGMVDLSARNGLPGKLLLDPDEIVISALGTDDAELIADGEILAGDGTGTFYISTTAIETQLNAGTDLYLQANNSVTLQTGSSITAVGTGDLELNGVSTGIYLDGDITIAGDLILSTGGVITPGAGVTLTAYNISLTQNANLALGNLTALNDLTVVSTLGGVTDDATATINVTGATSVDAAQDILLDSATNVFGGAITLTGEDINITGTSDLSLGTITANANAADATVAGDGDVTLGGGAIAFGGALTTVDDLTVNATGVVSQTAAISIAGALDVNASGQDVTLANTANDFNDVDVLGAIVSLGDADNITLGLITADQLTVTSGGAILDTTASVIDIDGAANLTATNQIDIRRQGAHTVDGTVTLSASQVVDFATLGGVTIGDVTATDGTNAENRITSANGVLALDGTISISGTSDLYLRSGGQITQTGAITADQLLFAGVQLKSLTGANDVNSLYSPGNIGSLTFNDTDGVDLAGVTADTLTITAGGDVTDSVANAITTATSITATGATITLDETGNAFGTLALAGGGTGDVSNVTDLELGDVNLATLTLNVTGTLTQAAMTSLTVTADTSLTATEDILLANAANAIAGNVTLSGEDINLDAGGDITLGAITASNAGADATVAGAGDVTLSGGAITFGAALTGVNDLTLYATGAVGQTAALSIGGDLDIDATGQNVTLADATNDFNTIAIDGAVVSVGDADDLALGAINASQLTVVAGDAVTDSAASTITTATSITATGSTITLDEAGSTFGALSLTANEATLQNVTDPQFGDVDVATLTVDVTGTVTQAAATSLTVTNSTSITATEDILLANSGNAIAGAVALSGEDINLDAGGNVTLGAITASNAGADATIDGAGDVTVSGGSVAFGGALNGVNDLSVTATGGVSQATPITIGGALDVNAAGQTVDLSDMANDFQGVVDVEGQNVTLIDANSLTLGLIDAGGTFTVEAKAGDVLDTGTSVIDVEGLATFTASNNITVNRSSTHGFADGLILDANRIVNFEINNQGVRIDSITTSGTNVENTIEIDNGVTDLAGDVTLATDADITFRMRGDITQSNGRILADRLNIVAFGSDTDVTLESVTNDLNTLRVGRQANVQLGDVSVRNVDALELQQIRATDLRIETGGAITQTDRALVIGDATFITTGDAVSLTNANNEFVTVDVDTTSQMSAAANVSITELDDVELGDISAASLTLLAGGSVSQTETTTITATGTTTLSVTGTVTLEEATNDFAAVTGTAGGVSLQDATGITVEALTATDGSIAITSVSDLTVATDANISATDDVALTTTLAGSGLSVTGTSQITADSDMLMGGDVTLRATDGFLFANSANAAISGANVTLDGGVVTASATITATTGGVDIDGTGGVLLTGVVTATSAGSTVTIDSTGDISVASIDANAISAETTGGSIIQTGGTITTAAGTDVSDFTATGSVTLNEAGNNFGGPVALSGQTLTIRDTDALLLDDVNATGTFTVNAGGAVTQNGTSTITAAQTATVTASGQTIDLSNDNDFQSTFAATGGDVSVTDTNAIELGAISASTLTVDAGGAVTQSAAATVANETTVTGTGQSVDLDNAANAFTGVVNVTGGAVEIDNSIALGLGDITASTLDADAATGDVTNAAGDVLSVTGTTTITADAGAISIASDATDNEDLRQTVTLSAAGDISLTGVNSQKLVLGDVTSDTGTVTVDVASAVDLSGNVSASAGGDAVTLRSAGDITQVTGAISATELIVDSDGNAVTLETATNAFTTLTLGSNGAVSVVEADGLAIGQEAMGGQATLTLRSGGAISQASSLTVTNNADFVTEGGSITLNVAGNMFGSVSADTSYNMAAADTVTITEADATEIGGITATSATVTSSGSITQTGVIDAYGDSSFTAAGDITLTNPANDFADAGSGYTAAFSGGTVDVTDVDTIALGNVVSSASTTITADDAGASGNFSGGLTELRFFDTEGDMVLSSALVLPATVVEFTADSVGAIDAQALSLANANTLLDATTSVTFSTGAGTFASLTVNAPVGIYQSAPITVSGETDLNSGAAGQVNLNNPSNDFQGRVDANASGVVLYDANNLELALINSDTLIANAGGDITDQGAKIEGRNNAVFTATGDINIDTLDTHVFNYGVSLSADQIVRFAATNTLSLNSVTATNADDVVNRITATGGITLDGAIMTAGSSDLTLDTTNANVLQRSGTLVTDELTLNLGSGDGTFVAGTNDINTLSVPAAANVALTDTDGVTIASVDATTLTVTAGAAIDQQAMSTITLTGLADLTATGANITLDEATNDFASIDAEGSDLTFRDANGVELTDIDASGALTVNALNGAITDGDAGAVGDDVNVAGATMLTATGAITLDDATNDFGLAVDASGASVTLSDANSIILGDIDTVGALVVEAVSGAITDDGDGAVGEDINAGTAMLTATTDITLDDASHDFAGGVSASAGAVTVNDINSLQLDDIDATTLIATADAIDDGAAADAGDDVDVTGTATLTARTGDVTLDDASNNFGVVNASGVGVTLTDRDAIELGDIDATTLVVTATTIDDGAAGMAGDDVNVTGTTTLTASTTITLDDATNDFGGAVAADGTALTLRDANSIILGDIDAAGALVVDAVAGAISQDGDGAVGEDIDAQATATFTASTTITLTDASNDFESSVNADGTDVSLNDLNAVELADIDATSLTVTAGSIEDGEQGMAGDDVSVSGETSLTASTTITLDDATNDFGGAVAADGTAITLRDANNIVLGDIDAAGALVVDAVAGAISQDGDGAVGEDINAQAAATFTASTTITLTDASNDFGGAVNADGTDVSLNDLNAIELADIDATSLTVTAASIEDGEQGLPGEDVNVTGATSLTASTTITLDDATNDFGGAVSADGTAITLRDANSIILGDIDAAGALVVDAVAGAISQDGDGQPGEDIDAAAEATFTASTTITLTDASNDFQATVNADGTDVSINDLNALTLGDIDAATLAVTAGGAIDDGASAGANADIDVTGTTSLTAMGDITLDDATNNFSLAVSADGDAIALRDIDNIILGEVMATGSLTVTAAGSITDSAGASIAVAGPTTLTTGGAFDIALDNDAPADRHDFAAAVNADGQDITLIDRNGITLGTITTSGGTPDDTINVDGGADATDPGELIVIARGGAITQEMGNALTITGDATLEATDGAGTYFDITLTNTLNDFDSDNTDAIGDGDYGPDSVTFLGETVTINDTGPFFVYDSVANAGGVLTSQSGDLVINRLRVNADNGPLVGVALDGAIKASNLSGGSITLGGAGSTDGAATGASGVVAVTSFNIDALAVASDVSTSLNDGDAGAALKVAAPLQTFTFVTVDAFQDGLAADFNTVTGSTADQLILERMAFDGDITIAAGDVDLGHIDADDGFFVTALTGDIEKRADFDLDLGGAGVATFAVAGARGVADETVTLQTFDRLVEVGGAASFTATGGDVVITRSQSGRGGAKEVDLQGPVSIAATDAAIEDQNSLILGEVAVDNNVAIRINTDNTDAATETLTQTASQTITVGGDLALITGDGDTARSNITLPNVGNSFTTVSALAGDLSIRGADAFTLQTTDLTGGLTIGSAGAQHGGDLVLQDVQLDGDFGVDATGAVKLTRIDVAGADGAAAQAGAGLTATDLRADNAVALATTGGDLSVTDVIIGAFDFDSAGALTVTNLSTAGSEGNLSTAAGDITVANIVSAANASFDSTGGALDIDSARIGSTLTLSANGDVTLGAIATGDDISATSDTASVLIRDAVTEAPADIIVDGVQAADIGFASEALVVDGLVASTLNPWMPDNSDTRVVETIAGTAGQSVDPADFTLQLAIGGDAAFDAAGSVLLPREAASEGGFQNDFMGDVAIAATTGNALIEDANALSFSTVTITSGDLSARSNADNMGAGEGITQTAAISVGGAASFVTGDHGGAAIADEAILADVTLDNAANDFTGAVSIVADNATLADANAITVANGRVAGDLSVTNGATATDGATLSDVQTGGAATIDAAGPIDLDRLAIGGELTATSRLAGLTANDLAVTGATGLTASTTLSLDDALLADATITAGASGALSDVSAEVINVQTGGVTISGLSATTTTVASAGPADIEQISTAAATITVTDDMLALSQAEVAGPLTARAGTGAIALADVNVAGDAVIDGGAIGSDASGGGETRLRVTGALDLDGDTVDLTDLSILGATALDAAGDVTLDDASFADLALSGAGDVTVTDASAAKASLNAGGSLDVTNMRMGTLDANAVGVAEFEATQIAGDADILSTGADVRLGGVAVGGALTAEAAAGSVTTFAGGLALAEVTVAAPVATALPEFTVEGPAAAEIGAEAALTNSPAEETRVVETLTAVADRTNPALNGAQAADVTLSAQTNARLLEVAGSTTITASDDVTLDDTDVADATVTAGDAATLTTLVAETLSVTTGGALTASVLNAAETTISSGGVTDLSDVATATATITVADADLNARRVETNGSLTLTTGAGDIAVADLNVTGDAAISGANIGSDASGGGETRIAIGGMLDVDGTGDVALTDLSVAGATEVTAGGTVSLDDVSLAAATVTGGGDVAITDGQTANAALSSGGALSASNLRTASLEAEATDDVALDAMQIAGDASILSTAGEIGLGSVAISGQLAAESQSGAIRTTDSDFALGPVTIAAPVPATVPSFAANTAPAAVATLVGEDANETLLSVGGDAYFRAAGDIALVDDASGVTGDNDFLGGVTALSGGSVILNDANDLTLGAPTGVAAPGGGAFDVTGVTAENSLRVEVGGSVTDADTPQATLSVGDDALFLAGGDVLLDNETHAIGGAIGAEGENITLTETGTIRLGPINASGDLMVEAGANNNAAGGSTAAAAIIQEGEVTVADAEVGADVTPETSEGPVVVDDVSTFATGLNPNVALGAPQLTGNRDLVLDDPANNFGGRLNIARISGDATITENSLPGATSGVQEIGNFEIGGSTRLTMTDNVIFVGRLTALTDDVEPDAPPSRPSGGAAIDQGDLSLADEDLRLFVASDQSLIIDTTGGGVNEAGADVRFDRPVDGDNDAPPRGDASIRNEREDLGQLAITAGSGGEVRFRDFVGAQNPLGDVDIAAGDIFSGFTFAEATPDLIFPGVTSDNRFLYDRLAPDDFFFAGNVRVNAPGRIEFLTPFGTVDDFILFDQYFGVNVTRLAFGDQGLPTTIQAFGFIGADRSRAIGLLPIGPRGSEFQFNDCVIGDVADCTNIPIPNVINNILIAAPPLLGIDTEDLLELFGSFGNEELWGVPQSYYSDLGADQENKPECPEGSEDPACKEG